MRHFFMEIYFFVWGHFYDILNGMRRMYLLCLLGTLAAAGCNSDRPVAYEYDEYDAYLMELGCNGGNPDCLAHHSAQYASGTSGVLYAGGNDGQAGTARYVTLDGKPVKEIKFSTPAGNDLRLETDEYVLKIEGAPNKQYDYYVWTGEKQYTDDPDLIIQNGTAAVLVKE